MSEEIANQERQAGIDLSIIFNAFWRHRRLFGITLNIGIVFGFVVAFSIPKTFESKVVLAPEISSSSGRSSNLSELASMVGVNIGSNSGSAVDAIYPELYPDIVSSSPFISELFDTYVTTKDSSLRNISFYDYLDKYQKSPWWSELLGGLTKLFLSNKPKVARKKGQTDPLHFTQEEEIMAKSLKQTVSCAVDRKTSIITISVNTQDPLVSKIVADSVQRHLQEYVTAYRTKKARADLAYTEKLYEQAKKDYAASQKAYSNYADANSELLLQSMITKRDELENEMQLRYNIYNQLTQQVQANKAKVQENTPAFTQIQPAQESVLKSGPKRGTIIAVWTLLSFFLTMFYALVTEIRHADKHKNLTQP